MPSQQKVAMHMHTSMRFDQMVVAKSTKQLSFYPVNAITPFYNT